MEGAKERSALLASSLFLSSLASSSRDLKFTFEYMLSA